MSENKWEVEDIGISQVPEEQCKDNALQLFYVWCAANIGILGIVYGAIIVSFSLSFWQSLLAALCGVLSFALVSITSLAGKKGRSTTLTLSRAAFGIKGNIAPTTFSWINLMGWEAINVVTGSLTLLALLQTLGLPDSTFTKLVSVVIFLALVIIVSVIGKDTVMWFQNWITKIFGTFTMIVAFWIFATTDWHLILQQPSGDWLTGFLPAVSIIAAGTGISWAIAGADYSRYQQPTSSSRSIFSAVLLGGVLPLMLLMLAGILLSNRLTDLSTAANPIELIGTALPAWMAIPYLITAVIGIVTIAVLSLYSASLNLLTIGVKVKQSVAVCINSVLIILAAYYMLFVSDDFMTPFISFLIFCGVFLSAWIAIFITDYFLLRQNGYTSQSLFSNDKAHAVKKATLFCWLSGALSGLMVSKTGFIDGIWAVGIFADSSLGLFVSFFISFCLYFIYLLLFKKDSSL